MPIALAIAATDRSISAVRMTKVSPTAMMPVIDAWLRMFIILSTVRKLGACVEKKITSTISVNTGAMLRICSARNRFSSKGRAVSASASCRHPDCLSVTVQVSATRSG